ncbi:HET-domain-containing protein [Paraphaeosphaeria sporulosa]|uniref:HET-domain-containing protein n=1 Tax=Paraphaeosphaeria sporulosa TaxID=1460663 RepID=A0A177CY50_9PLEO|nr:HET-domain-containing protein [Paraphaeosphaeria sporulosa]OAG12146.1 HET-domain-containing protein [Paraphaeosphaeria sporulosa]
MHLLKYGENGDLAITSFDDNELPPYAILSHTWGADEEEVTFTDIVNNGGKDKPGYKKIRFCGEQASRDGLEYFWIDTCCINKENQAELSLAIDSMFRWYRNSARCYVYLSDVSSQTLNTNPEPNRSRWFTRGWTLQELLAPSVVEFFSREWCKLGDKISLKSEIHEVTAIPYEALEGAPLSQFSVEERFRWRQNRHTKLKEDAAYSLSGIFDVDIAPIYGEGGEEAFRRLHDKIREQVECLRDLFATDPLKDKKRIEETKGGLLANSYRWVLDNTTFQQWQQDTHSRLLWVKGDPGKGKTMLLCGIINELHKAPNHVTVSHFFCQATDSRINSATAALRGLLYMLLVQQPSLVSHVRKKHDYAGRSLFEDANAWVALTEIFVDVLRDPSLRPTYLVIDALDECVTDLPMLLDFVAKQSSVSSCVKWIVSSRNWPNIEAQLERAGHKVRLSLELNAESVAAAVAVFIQRKVDQLAQEKQYKAEVRDAVLQHLTTNANDTFLWVALVCQELGRTANRHVLKKLAVFPPGLDDLYKRMMQQMSESDDADTCRCVLASTAVLYRPVTIHELVALIEQPEDVSNDMREIIDLCGSFLTVREDTVYFVHQSAKDFLLVKASNEVFPNGMEEIHRAIFSTSLAHLSSILHRDMYSLKALGSAVKNVKPPHPDPLAASHYPYRLTQLVQDARRFVMYHKQAIESYPLQTYTSALLFSPTGSLIRQLFRHEEPRGIAIMPAMSDSWSACLQTLEGHSGLIWDASSGACLQTLLDSRAVNSVDLVSILALSHFDKIITNRKQSVCQEVTISSDNIWVSDNVQKLWLPTEYRPVSSATSSRCIGVGTGSGKIWICSFE